ncbi:MAG: glycosyl hydrolase family 28-related protein [Bacillota bacterium]
MASERTDNLNLHDWVGKDEVKREELSDNFNIIDQAVGKISKLGPNLRSLSDSTFENGINVKDYGAKGNGSADDTLPIINAINFALNTLSANASGKYGISFRVKFPAGRYRVTDTLTITKSIHSSNSTIGRGSQLIIEGDGLNTSIELDRANSTLFDVYNISVVFENIGLWATKGKSTVFVAGRSDPNDATNMLEVRQARFSNVFFRGFSCMKINRMFDSSFYDCFFALSEANGVALDVTKPSFNNSNNVNFRRCHFEVGHTNGTWVRVRGDASRYDGFHHGFNFDGCHFETRSYSMKILDLYMVNSFTFYRCQFTQNRKSDLSDSVADAVHAIILERVSGITFDTSSIARIGDQSSAPLLIKLKGVCNAVTFRNIMATTCGTGTGGRNNLINESECTTKRGIRIENSMLTSIENKSSDNNRLFVSDPLMNNRDWQIFTNNQNLLLGYTNDTTKDILTKGDETYGFSMQGQFKSKYGFTGTNATIAVGATYTFILPPSVSSNGRGLYMFNISDPSANYFGILSKSESKLVSVIISEGITNGNTTEPNDSGKINVWLDVTTNSMNFKNNLSSPRDIMITPFAFGDQFK